MANVSLAPDWGQHFHDNNGYPATGWRVYVFESNTEDYKASYSDSNGTTLNTQPIILNSRGEYGEGLFLVDGEAYTLELREPGGSVVKTVNNIIVGAGGGDAEIILPAQTVLGNISGGQTAGYPVTIESDLSTGQDDNIPNVGAVNLALDDYLPNSGDEEFTGTLDIVGTITENGEDIDKKTVKVSSNDGAEGYLETKIVGAGDVSVSTIGEGNYEQVEISVTNTANDHKVQVSANDTTPDYLSQKVTASGTNTISVDNEAGDEVLNIFGTGKTQLDENDDPAWLQDKIIAGNNITINVVSGVTGNALEIETSAPDTGEMAAMSSFKSSAGGDYTPEFPFPMDYGDYELDKLGSAATWDAPTAKVTANVAGLYMVEAQCNSSVLNLSLTELTVVKLDNVGAETSDFIKSKLVNTTGGSANTWPHAAARGLFELDIDESVQFGFKNTSGNVSVNDVSFSVIKVELSSATLAGSGTLNTLPLWTPDGETLGDSKVRQDTDGLVYVDPGVVDYGYDYDVALVQIGDNSTVAKVVASADASGSVITLYGITSNPDANYVQLNQATKNLYIRDGITDCSVFVSPDYIESNYPDAVNGDKKVRSEVDDISAGVTVTGGSDSSASISSYESSSQQKVDVSSGVSNCMASIDTSSVSGKYEASVENKVDDTIKGVAYTIVGEETVTTAKEAHSTANDNVVLSEKLTHQGVNSEYDHSVSVNVARAGTGSYVASDTSIELTDEYFKRDISAGNTSELGDNSFGKVAEYVDTNEAIYELSRTNEATSIKARLGDDGSCVVVLNDGTEDTVSLNAIGESVIKNALAVEGGIGDRTNQLTLNTTDDDFFIGYTKGAGNVGILNYHFHNGNGGYSTINIGTMKVLDGQTYSKEADIALNTSLGGTVDYLLSSGWNTGVYDISLSIDLGAGTQAISMLGIVGTNVKSAKEISDFYGGSQIFTVASITNGIRLTSQVAGGGTVKIVGLMKRKF